MKKSSIFGALLCGAMLVGFTACENGNEPNNDGSGDNSGNNTPTFDLKVDVEPVDLGLPSGTLWAPYNVGATAPEEFGSYFAWAETEPKENYSGNNYKYGTGSGESYIDSFTKYCVESDMGTVDGKTKLEPIDDAATVNWGGDWRMPTNSELQELVDNCTWEWTTVNGSKGYKVIGKNGNSIFLPAAGIFQETGLEEANHLGLYLSSVLHGEWSGGSYTLWAAYYEDEGGYIEVEGLDRGNGASVRPVCSPK